MSRRVASPARTNPLAVAVRIILVMVALAPFVVPLTKGVPGLEYIGWGLDQWYGFQCHRDPDRSLHLFGRVLPVCMRCLGIYLGLGMGALVMRPRLTVVALRVWVVAAAALMLADVATIWLGLQPGWSASRLVTGLALSYPVGIALVQASRGEKV